MAKPFTEKQPNGQHKGGGICCVKLINQKVHCKQAVCNQDQYCAAVHKVQQTGFTLIEITVSLLGASLIALAVLAMIMPLKQQVIKQLQWSEMAQNGRVATLVLMRLAQCAKINDITANDLFVDAQERARDYFANREVRGARLSLLVNRQCAAEHGLGLENTTRGFPLDEFSDNKEGDEKTNEQIQVMIESRRVCSVNMRIGYHYGLFLKVGDRPAQEWLQGVQLVRLAFVDHHDQNHLLGVQAVLVQLDLEGRWGMTQPWRVYLNLT